MGLLLLRLAAAVELLLLTREPILGTRPRPRGFMSAASWAGVYNGDDIYPSIFNRTERETIWDTFRFGRVTIDNSRTGSAGPAQSTFRESVALHCARSNAIFGVVNPTTAIK